MISNTKCIYQIGCDGWKIIHYDGHENETQHII